MFTIKKSNTISILKGVAIFSVICAHCNSIPVDAIQFEQVSSLILRNLGTIGVICFFIVSGYLFNCRSKKEFFLSRLKSIILPWLVGATGVYLYVALRKPPILFYGWFSFFIGNGSYFYYLTILMLLYILFAFIPFLKKNVPCLVIVAITVVSTMFFYAKGVIVPTAYLDVFNWIGYFALGIFIRSNQELFEKLFVKIYSWRWIPYILFLGFMIYRVWNNQGGGYWGMPNVLFAWLGAITFLLISSSISKLGDNLFVNSLCALGDSSLFIYIWHMPIAGIITNIFSRSFLTMFVLIRPFVTLAIVVAAYCFLKFILDKFHIESVGAAIGIRIKRGVKKT